MASRAQPAALSQRANLYVASVDSRRRRALLIIASIALLPILVVLALRLPLINQLDYADAWFYSSYAWAPKHDFEIFGWNYFAARFPAVLAIGVFKRIFGVAFGYVVLRYLLAVACGCSLYACVRRFASIQVSLGAVALLYLQPFFSRTLLWDYSSFIEVSAGLIGVSLWYWSDGKRLAWTLLPGAALALAAFANALFATALFVLFVVEAATAIRQGRNAAYRYLARVGVVVAAAVGVFLIGYLGYVTILSGFSPYEMLRPTIEFLKENSKNSAPYQVAVSRWLLHEPRLWMPVITSISLVALLRGRLLGVDVVARMAQMCVGYTAFLWVYRFAVTSSLVETWWAYNVTVVATAPAMGVMLCELTSKGHSRQYRLPTIIVGAFALSAILIRNVPSTVKEAYLDISDHRGLLLGLLIIGLVSAVALGLRRSIVRAVAAVVFVTVLTMMSFAPSVLDGRGSTGIFATRASREWNAYQEGARFIDLIQNYDSPAHRVFLWYPQTLGYVSIAWNDLPQDADTLNEVGVDEPVTHLTPLGVTRLRSPGVRYVMVLSPRRHDLVDARAALGGAGFSNGVLREGSFGERHLYFTLLSINSV
jgi:hypothetical protein